MAVIEVNRLSKHFGALRAVDDLSFSVEEGDVYGFLGQNGAGKSTTIRMLLTLIRPSAGEIRFFGKDLATHRHEILSQVGAVIERPDLYKYLSGYENVALFARLSGLRPDRRLVMAQLERVGLADRADSRVHTYSLGMKQRLGIAVALVHDPALIILDEPANGLDPQGIADMRHLILHLSRDLKKTLVISSHLLAEMQLTATRLLIMDRGRKVVERSMRELTDPAATVVEVTLAGDAADAVRALAGSPFAPRIIRASENRLVFRLHAEDVPGLTRALVEAGLAVEALKPQNSLEAYFLSHTGTPNHVAAAAH